VLSARALVLWGLQSQKEPEFYRFGQPGSTKAQ